MKFVDEATIWVKAGNGGGGCLSFRREKFIPRGGPDGGDGGNGGTVYLKADGHINTLIDFRYQRRYAAENGEPGSGNLRQGKSGADLYISVPVGTEIYDAETEERLGDLAEEGRILCVAQGGFHGLGNARYKSSINRAPRQTKPGAPGEERELKLVLKVLADVGLLGLPNAGKSTFINAVSNAKPKIADYPFTTLHPHLGVVRVDEFQSFVLADLPGLIPGASEGAGLGIRFLKHLSRCRLLLHFVDIYAADNAASLVEAVESIFHELQSFSPELAQKERWLIFNKVDLLPEEEVQKRIQETVKLLEWKGPVYSISAATHLGCRELCRAVMQGI